MKQNVYLTNFYWKTGIVKFLKRSYLWVLVSHLYDMRFLSSNQSLPYEDRQDTVKQGGFRLI